MWHPSKDGFIVAGGGFLATNSSGPELLDAFAKVARLSKMTFSHGKAVPAVELSVESKLAAEQIVVQWTKRAGAAVWPSVAPRSRRP